MLHSYTCMFSQNLFVSIWIKQSGHGPLILRKFRLVEQFVPKCLKVQHLRKLLHNGEQPSFWTNAAGMVMLPRVTRLLGIPVL